MAGFNVIAQIQLQTPPNLAQVAQQVRNAFQNISGKINISLPPGFVTQLTGIQNSLTLINGQLKTLAATGPGAAKTFAGVGAAAGQSTTKVAGFTSTVRTLSAQNSTLLKTTEDATDGLTEFGKSAGLAARRFTGFTVVASALIGTITAIKTAVQEALEFNRELIRISQVSGDTAATTRGLEREVSRLSSAYGVSSKELVKAAVTLRQAGLSTRETKTSLEALAKAALSPSFDNIAETAEGAIAIFAQFKLEAKDLEKTLGSLNAVSAQYAVESADLLQNIRRAGGAFNAIGGDIKELSALFTSIRATTRESAESISTGLRTIFARLQRQDTVASLKAIGVNLRFVSKEAELLGNKDLTSQFVGGYEAVLRISEALKDIPATDPRFSAIVEQLGGYRQISRVIPLLQQTALAQKALVTAQIGGLSLTTAADKANEDFLRNLSKIKEEFLALGRAIVNSSGFQALLNIFLTVSKAAVQFLSVIKDLVPLLGLLAAVNIGKTFSQLASGKGFLGGVSSGFSGSSPKRLARGGVVPGAGNSDSVPSLLTPGEFVVNQRAARSIGYGNLSALNKKQTGGFTGLNQLLAGKRRFKVGEYDLSENNVKFLYQLAGGTQKERDGLLKRNQSKLKALFGELDGGGDYTDYRQVFAKLDPSVTPRSSAQSLREFRKTIQEGSDFAAQRRQNIRTGNFVKGNTIHVPFRDSIGYVGFELEEPEKGKSSRGALNAGIRTKEASVKSVKGLGNNAKNILLASGIENVFGGVNTYAFSSSPKEDFAREVRGAVGEKIQEVFTEKFGASRTADLKEGQTATIGGYLFEKYVEGLAGRFTGGEKDDFEYTNGIKGSSTLGKAFDKFVFPSPITSKYVDLKYSANRKSVESVIGKYLNLTARSGELLQTISGSSGGVKNKTQARAFAGGGYVPGVGDSDSVPAMLTPGEYVIRKSAAKNIGYDKLAGLNRYASGGLVVRDDAAIFLNAGRIGPTQERPFYRTVNDNEVVKLFNVLESAGYRRNANSPADNFITSDNEPNPLISVGGKLHEVGVSSQAKTDIKESITSGIESTIANTIQVLAQGRSLQETTKFNREELEGVFGIGGAVGQIFEVVLAAVKGSPVYKNNAKDNFDFQTVKKNDFDRLFTLNRKYQYGDARVRGGGTKELSLIGKLSGVAHSNPGIIPKLFTKSSLGSIRKKDRKEPLTAKEVGTRIKRADGGPIPGTDSVPSLLTPGEFVINRESAAKIGAGNLDRLNRYAKGGPVGPLQFQGGSNVPSFTEKFIDFIDAVEANIESYLEQAIQKVSGFFAKKGPEVLRVPPDPSPGLPSDYKLARDRVPPPPKVPSPEEKRNAKTGQLTLAKGDGKALDALGFDLDDFVQQTNGSVLALKDLVAIVRSLGGDVSKTILAFDYVNKTSTTFGDAISSTAPVLVQFTKDAKTGQAIVKPKDFNAKSIADSIVSSPDFLTDKGETARSKIPNPDDPEKSILGAIEQSSFYQPSPTQTIGERAYAIGNLGENISKGLVSAATAKQKLDENLAKIQKDLVDTELKRIQGLKLGIKSQEALAIAQQNAASALQANAQVYKDQAGKFSLFDGTKGPGKAALTFDPANAKAIEDKALASALGTTAGSPAKVASKDGFLARLRKSDTAQLGLNIAGTYAAGLFAPNLEEIRSADSQLSLQGQAGLSGGLQGAFTGLQIAGPIGAAVGAVIGFGASIDSVSKRIREVKLAESLEKLEDTVTKFNKGKAGLGQVASELTGIRKQINREAIEKAGGLFGAGQAQAQEGFKTGNALDAIFGTGKAIVGGFTARISNLGKSVKEIEALRAKDIQKQSDKDFRAAILPKAGDIFGGLASLAEKEGKKLDYKGATKGNIDKILSDLLSREGGAGNIILENLSINNPDLGKEFKDNLRKQIVTASGRETLSRLDFQAQNVTRSFQRLADQTSLVAENFAGAVELIGGGLPKIADGSSTLEGIGIKGNRAGFNAVLGDIVSAVPELSGQAKELSAANDIGIALEQVLADSKSELLRKGGDPQRFVGETLRHRFQGPEAEKTISRITSQLAALDLDKLGEAYDDIGALTAKLIGDSTKENVKAFQQLTKTLSSFGGTFLQVLENIQDKLSRVEEESSNLDRLRSEQLNSNINQNNPLGNRQTTLAQAFAPFTNRQFRLAGAAGQDPEALQAAISRNRERADGISAKIRERFVVAGTPEFAKAAQDLTSLRAETKRYEEALKKLTETNDRASEIQGRLNKLEEDRQSRLGIAEKYATGGPDEIFKLEQGAGLIRAAAAQGGNFNNFNVDQRRLVLETLRQYGNASLQGLPGQFQGITGGKFSEVLLKNFAPQLASLAPEQQNQETILKEELKNVFNLAVRAQSAIVQLFTDEASNATRALTVAVQEFTAAVREARGGFAPRPGFAAGGQARGTDTVPAMLTPGEFVVNRKSAQANRGILERINGAGGPVYLAGGGTVAARKLAADKQKIVVQALNKASPNGIFSPNIRSPYGVEGYTDPELSKLLDTADNQLLARVYAKAQLYAIDYIEYRKKVFAQQARGRVGKPALQGAKDRIEGDIQGLINQETPESQKKLITSLPSNIQLLLKQYAMGDQAFSASTNALTGDQLKQKYINEAIPAIINATALSDRRKAVLDKQAAAPQNREPNAQRRIQQQLLLVNTWLKELSQLPQDAINVSGLPVGNLMTDKNRQRLLNAFNILYRGPALPQSLEEIAAVLPSTGAEQKLIDNKPNNPRAVQAAKQANDFARQAKVFREKAEAAGNDEDKAKFSKIAEALQSNANNTAQAAVGDKVAQGILQAGNPLKPNEIVAKALENNAEYQTAQRRRLDAGIAVSKLLAQQKEGQKTASYVPQGQSAGSGGGFDPVVGAQQPIEEAIKVGRNDILTWASIAEQLKVKITKEALSGNKSAPYVPPKDPEEPAVFLQPPPQPKPSRFEPAKGSNVPLGADLSPLQPPEPPAGSGTLTPEQEFRIEQYLSKSNEYVVAKANARGARQDFADLLREQQLGNSRAVAKHYTPIGIKVFHKEPVPIQTALNKSQEEYLKWEQTADGFKLQARGVFGFAEGGVVPGTGSGDTIPSLLTPGEFVLNRSAAQAIGLAKLSQFNKAPSYFQDGGVAGKIRTRQEASPTVQLAADLNGFSQTLTAAFTQFGQSVSNLSAAISAFPKEITGSFSHTVAINITGADILTQVPELAKAAAVKVVNDKLAQFIQKNMPDAGIDTGQLYSEQ